MSSKSAHSKKIKALESVIFDLEDKLEEINNILWNLAEAEFTFRIEHNFDAVTGKAGGPIPYVSICGENDDIAFDWTD